jgi:hypothetical protein
MSAHFDVVGRLKLYFFRNKATKKPTKMIELKNNKLMGFYICKGMFFIGIRVVSQQNTEISLFCYKQITTRKQR